MHESVSVQDRAREQRDIINNKCNFNGFSFYIHVASSYSFSPRQKIHVKFHDKKVHTSKQPSLNPTYTNHTTCKRSDTYK